MDTSKRREKLLLNLFLKDVNSRSVIVSVTRRLDYLFNFWPFIMRKICLITLKDSQNKLTVLQNTKWTILKWSEFFNIAPKWRSFAKSGHTYHRPSMDLCIVLHRSSTSVAATLNACSRGTLKVIIFSYHYRYARGIPLSILSFIYHVRYLLWHWR